MFTRGMGSLLPDEEVLPGRIQKGMAASGAPSISADTAATTAQTYTASIAQTGAAARAQID
jgi:hypothetical protein